MRRPSSRRRGTVRTIGGSSGRARPHRRTDWAGQGRSEGRRALSGGSIPFGYRLGDDGDLVPHEPEQEAIREMIALPAHGRSLRAIAAEMQTKGLQHQLRGRRRGPAGPPRRLQLLLPRRWPALALTAPSSKATHLALLSHFHVSGLWTCRRQCGHR
jgi:hypothetical protein